MAQSAATQAWGTHLQLKHALLDGVRGDVAEDRHSARLPQTVDAVLRLVLRCRPAAQTHITSVLGVFICYNIIIERRACLSTKGDDHSGAAACACLPQSSLRSLPLSVLLNISAMGLCTNIMSNVMLQKWTAS